MQLIAKTADEALNRVKDLEFQIKHPVIPPQKPAIESTIELNKPQQHIKVDVVFDGFTNLPYDDRMKKSEDFLKQVMELMGKFGVITCRTNYNKNGLVQ